MKLKTLLLERKSAILEKWCDVILETYPAETSNFIKTQKNRFTNPVGHTIFQGIERIFEELLGETDFDLSILESSLLDIIRIRAVQDFTPAEAISFIFLLKRVIREELKSEIPSDTSYEELIAFESKIDEIALLCFDLYMKCREKIYELRANELRRMTFGLLRRANQIQGEL